MQGNSTDMLPEVLLGSVRLHKVHGDLTHCVCVCECVCMCVSVCVSVCVQYWLLLVGCLLVVHLATVCLRGTCKAVFWACSIGKQTHFNRGHNPTQVQTGKLPEYEEL